MVKTTGNARGRKSGKTAQWLGILLPVLAFLLLAAPVLGAERDFPALTGRVVDRADLFTQEEEDELTRVLADLEAATTHQFVVATIQSVGDDEIKMYAAELGHYWRLGQKGKDNGALLLVAIRDRQVAIQVGYGLEPVLTDGQSGEIIQEQILPFFRRGDYFGGVKA
ncbi:MAG: TPM domain-containing protein, partial [Bacillota bacterium]